MNADSKDWMLPIRILNEGIARFELNGSIKDFSNPDSFPVVSKLIKGPVEVPKAWKVIHWMNEEFRRLAINKNAVIKGSVLHQLMEKYEVEIDVLTGNAGKTYRSKLSRPHYIYVTLKARIDYFMQKITK